MEEMNEDMKEIIMAFKEGHITKKRMDAWIEEAKLRKLVTNQVNAMDAEELTKVIEFIETQM
jgi:uncharacterized membrane protein YheB (UPF0754 family)